MYICLLQYMCVCMYACIFVCMYMHNTIKYIILHFSSTCAVYTAYIAYSGYSKLQYTYYSMCYLTYMLIFHTHHFCSVFIRILFCYHIVSNNLFFYGKRFINSFDWWKFISDDISFNCVWGGQRAVAAPLRPGQPALPGGAGPGRGLGRHQGRRRSRLPPRAATRRPPHRPLPPPRHPAQPAAGGVFRARYGVQTDSPRACDWNHFIYFYMPYIF